METKTTVAFIFGGCSTEYPISLQSAYAVLNHIDCNKYIPVMIGITPRGEWFHFTGDISKIVNDKWHNDDDCTPAILSPDREIHGIIELCQNNIRRIHIDIAFPILHGKNGEDGTIQGLLELANIPIAGCHSLCSALCMDKDKAHKIAHLAGVKTPRSFILKRKTDILAAEKFAENIGFPVFVKPVKAGSSFGITKVWNQHNLPAAINLAFTHDNEVIIEQNIIGFEVGGAVLGNDNLVIGEVDEIELANGFFDFAEKYTCKTATIHVPARISAEKSAEIKETVAIIYNALGCRGFARVDLFLTPFGEIIFNEVNTIPGFTPHSRYPNMLKSAGISFNQVIERIIELSVEK